MIHAAEIKVKGVPYEAKQKLIIIAKENGYDNLSEFLRNQFKVIANNGIPAGREKPSQLLLDRIDKRIDNLTFAVNENNQIYATDQEILKRVLGDD